MDVTFIKTSQGTTAVPTTGNSGFLSVARLLAERTEDSGVTISESKEHHLRSLREMKEIANNAGETFIIVAESRPLSGEALADAARSAEDVTEVLSPAAVIRSRR